MEGWEGPHIKSRDLGSNPGSATKRDCDKLWLLQASDSSY